MELRHENKKGATKGKKGVVLKKNKKNKKKYKKICTIKKSVLYLQSKTNKTITTKQNKEEKNYDNIRN